MGEATGARLALRTTAIVTLGAATASLTMVVTRDDAGPARAVPWVAHTCAPVPYAGAGADVVLDLATAVAPVPAVQVRAGQTLGIGGRSGCALTRLPAAATAGPLLQEVARHTTAAGDLDVEYRALRPGTVTLPLCAGSCTPAAVMVTVLAVSAP